MVLLEDQILSLAEGIVFMCYCHFHVLLLFSSGVCCVGELAAVPLRRLEAVCGQDDAMWLHRLSRGIDDEEVTLSLLPHASSSLFLCVPDMAVQLCSVDVSIMVNLPQDFHAACWGRTWVPR